MLYILYNLTLYNLTYMYQCVYVMCMYVLCMWVFICIYTCVCVLYLHVQFYARRERSIPLQMVVSLMWVLLTVESSLQPKF